MAVTVPYENATSGAKAREEITALLRRMGCSEVGFMDDFERAEVLLAFRHRGRAVQLRANAKGWAQMFIKARPLTHRARCTQREYEQRALRQGLIAVNSILRDWVKGQVVAVECGMLSFEAVFVPHMLTNDGRPMIERILESKLLPPPTQKGAPRDRRGTGSRGAGRSATDTLGERVRAGRGGADRVSFDGSASSPPKPSPAAAS